jgi:hypothetical protein
MAPLVNQPVVCPICRTKSSSYSILFDELKRCCICKFNRAIMGLPSGCSHANTCRECLLSCTGFCIPADTRIPLYSIIKLEDNPEYRYVARIKPKQSYLSLFVVICNNLQSLYDRYVDKN